MRKIIKPILVAVVTAGLIAGFAATAPAAVSEKSVKKFCKKALAVQTTLARPVETDDVEDVKNYASDAENGLKKLAKLAPTKKLRKAVKTMAKHYGEIEDTGDPSGAYSDPELDAIETITTYTQTTCVPLVGTPTT